MKRTILLAALIAASTAAFADGSCLKQPSLTITGDAELRPDQAWVDPAGLLHLRFNGATPADLNWLAFSKAESGSYSIPATEMDTRKGYVEMTVLDPVPTLVLRHNDREAVVAVR